MANFNGGVVGVDNPAVVQPEIITTFTSSGGFQLIGNITLGYSK